MRWRRGEGRKTGGIKAASKPFLQAFPNLGCFCPRTSKDFFGGFLGFQWVTREKTQSVDLQTSSSCSPFFGHVPDAIVPHSTGLKADSHSWAFVSQEGAGVFMAEEPSGKREL
jgi:hypothetical protein